MKKKLIFIILIMSVMNSIFAKDNLAILPFTGGQSAEGETIAELFSFDSRLANYFNLIPRTSITRAINREQGFQMNSGMTDADTIVSIGKQLGAQFVVAGSITSVGNNKLLVISIMDIRNLQQIAGDYQTYVNIEEIRGKLPNMAANIIQATQNNTLALPKLAIVPVQLQGGADQRDADTMAQLLAIHLIRSGTYAVFPRTKSLEQVMNEHDTQFSGVTADENVIGIGFGENPDLVLSVVARSLGTSNMFNAVIINISTGAQIVGRSVDYRNIDDGMRVMETLAHNLTSTAEQASQRADAERRAQDRDSSKDLFLRNSGVGFGLRAGVSIPFYGKTDPVTHVNYTSGNYYVFWEPSDIGIPFSFLAELKLGRFFSFQTEIQLNLLAPFFDYISNYGGKSPNGSPIEVHFMYMQIPLLAKINLSTGNFVFSPFTGVGLNIPIKANGIVKGVDDFYPKVVSMPPNIIFGFDCGVKIGGILLFADLRYLLGLSKTEIDTFVEWFYVRKFSFLQSSMDISLGVKYIIPFRK